MMRLPALVSPRNSWVAIVCAAIFALAPIPSRAQVDPPDQAGRLSWTSGAVSIQPVGTDDWGQAYANLSIGPGDRVFTESDGWAEIQLGQTYLRIGPNSDVSLVGDSPGNIEFGVARGSVHLRTFGLWQGQWLSVSTPNGNVRFDNAGELRVDILPEDGASIFTNLASRAMISGAGGFEEEIGNGQVLQLAGTNPVYPQWLQPAGPDSLDTWSQQRDEWILQATSYQYVSPDVPGVADLDANGDWMPDSDYGPIWFPRNVSAGWEPYHYGHWVNREPWGWVWVEDEPWGYAPFHYGRWVSYRGRWGWIPGPRGVRPVWSPALVVFAAGIQVGGVNVSAWFPLGPGEPYRPWYRCSPHYIDRVNISNIRESRRVRVRNDYRNEVNLTNINYVNRTIGVTAMRHEDFASGRPVRQAGVAVDARQLNRVQPLARPVPVPTRGAYVARPVDHTRPAMTTRPTFINQNGKLISSRPGAAPAEPPVRPLPPARIPRGRDAAAPPARTGSQPQASPRESPVRPYGRPIPAPSGRQEGNQSQPPDSGSGGRPEGRPALPPEARPVGKPIPAPTGGSERPPEARPIGKPVPAPPGRTEAKPNPPLTSHPAERPSGYPSQQPEVRPLGRPVPAPPEKREASPNQVPPERQSGQPAAGTARQPAKEPSNRNAAQPEPKPEKGKNGDQEKKDQQKEERQEHR